MTPLSSESTLGFRHASRSVYILLICSMQCKREVYLSLVWESILVWRAFWTEHSAQTQNDSTPYSTQVACQLGSLFKQLHGVYMLGNRQGVLQLPV